MPRHLRFQRLNMDPKHKWSMLRNMTASLFLHERIVTTQARAKSLISVANKIFSKAIRNDPQSVKIAKGWLRVPQANYKLFNDIIRRFKLNAGGIARMVKLQVRRQGDGSKMAYVELLENQHKEKEDADFDLIHQNSGYNFSKWELSTRTNELENYINEKEKRDQIYTEIKQKIKGLKQSQDIVTDSDIKELLFGEDLTIFKIESDPLLPQQHPFNLYIKATKGETELDKFYAKTNNYLLHLIRDTKEQIKILKNTMNDPRISRKYERNNFIKYYQNYENDYKKLEKVKEANREIREEKNNLLNDLANMRFNILLENKNTVDYINFSEQFFKKNNINPYKMNDEQQKEFDLNSEKYFTKLNLEKSLIDENLKEYESLVRLGEMNKKMMKQINKIKNKLKLIKEDQQKIIRVTPKNQDIPTIQNLHLLSQAELNINDVNQLKGIVDQTELSQLKLEQSERKERLERFKKLNEYETMMRKFNDRQVKKSKKPQLWDLRDLKEELFSQMDKREKEDEEKIGLTREDLIYNARLNKENEDKIRVEKANREKNEKKLNLL